MIVHGRHLERASGRGFRFLLLLPLARHFEDEIERIINPMPIIDPDDEVGVILMLDVVDRVGDREAETLVLDVGENFGHVFEVVGQLEFPSAVPGDVGDVALVGPGLVGFPDRVEVDVAGRADGVIGPENRLEGWRSLGRCDDRAVDPVGGFVGEPHEHEQLGKRSPLAGHTLGEPAPGDRQQLREEPGLVVPSVVAEVFLEGQLGQPERDFVEPEVLQVVERIDPDRADDALDFGLGRQVGVGQGELGIGSEPCGQPLAWQLVAISLQAGPGDLAGDPLSKGMNPGGRRAWPGHLRGSRARRNENGTP